MIDFYFYSEDRLALLLMGTLFLIVPQAGYASAIFLNNPIKRIKVLIGEVALLIYCTLLSMLPITVMTNKRYGIIDIHFISLLISIAGTFAVIYFLYLSVANKDKEMMVVVIILLTMPIISNYYTLRYVISMSILMVRAFERLSDEFYRQKHELSAFSIREGLDTLPSGVMFCEEGGYIYLINRKMEQLIMRFLGEVQKNGKDFWRTIESGNVKDVECQLVEGDMIIRTGRDSWRFSRKKFAIDGMNYIEIIATDVSKIATLLDKLEEDNEELIRQGEEIHRLSQKMEALRYEQEYSRIRSQVHDVMGQRLTAMQRILQSHDESDYKKMVPLLSNIIKQIKEKDTEDIKDSFAKLCDYFNQIGVSIELDGELPKEEHVAQLFLAVLREASTNAARHADATKIHSKIELDDTHYHIEITNNGTPPKTGIVEGTGLMGIRTRTENAGGTLKVELIPEFAIIITIGRRELENNFHA